MVLYPGMKELIGTLKQRGRQLALLTDMTAQIQFRKLKQLKLEGVFDHIVTSEEAGEEKPSGRMFELLLEKAGCAREEMLMIGDDEKKDIRGAEAFGISAALFRNEMRFYDEVRQWL